MTAANANQFPQPTRPLNSYEMSYEVPSTAYPQILENIEGHPQQSIYHHSDIYVAVPPTVIRENEREKKIHLVEKIVDKVLDKIVDKYPQSTTSRGLEQPVEAGEKEKLERFKIRTVVAEEVVVEEDNKK